MKNTKEPWYQTCLCIQITFFASWVVTAVVSVFMLIEESPGWSLFWAIPGGFIVGFLVTLFFYEACWRFLNPVRYRKTLAVYCLILGVIGGWGYLFCKTHTFTWHWPIEIHAPLTVSEAKSELSNARWRELYAMLPSHTQAPLASEPRFKVGDCVRVKVSGCRVLAEIKEPLDEDGFYVLLIKKSNMDGINAGDRGVDTEESLEPSSDCD